MCECVHARDADAYMAWLKTEKGQAHSAWLKGLLAEHGITDVINYDFKEPLEVRLEREERDRMIDKYLAMELP